MALVFGSGWRVGKRMSRTARDGGSEPRPQMDQRWPNEEQGAQRAVPKQSFGAETGNLPLLDKGIAIASSMEFCDTRCSCGDGRLGLGSHLRWGSTFEGWFEAKEELCWASALRTARATALW
jgi:hypothetical protein